MSWPSTTMSMRYPRTKPGVNPTAPAFRGWTSPGAGDVNAIAARYGGSQALLDTDANAVAVGGWQSPLDAASPATEITPRYARGKPESTGATPGWFNTALTDASARTSSMGPRRNAADRWSAGAIQGPNPDGSSVGSQSGPSQSRRNFWATGRIDASSRPDPRVPAPVTFKDSPSGWSAY